ncbi:MAG: hypothetical protein WA632_14575 [Gallionella sp.]
MPMPSHIEAAIRGFHDIFLNGIPILLRQNETAFLSFICSLAAIDALSGYRYETDKVGVRFPDFIKEYFPSSYAPHAHNLYLLRCRMLHNFSPAYFTVSHANAAGHLGKGALNEMVLSDDVFFADLREAAARFFAEVQSDSVRQDAMNRRLLDVEKGGAIYYE